MLAKRKMERYLGLIDPKVRKNVTVVTPKDLGIDLLSHISIDGGIRKFVPKISQRTAKKEDRSVPRISTAPTLAGAILGYQALEYDFEQGRHKKGFKGGWYIYGLPFEVALKPNNHILYDAKATEEVWLVPYDETQWEVSPQKMGKFFPLNISITFKGEKRSNQIEMVVHVQGESIQVIPDKAIAKGYHRLTLTNVDIGYSLKDVEVVDHTELTKAEYGEFKRLHASLLSHTESAQLPSSER